MTMHCNGNQRELLNWALTKQFDDLKSFNSAEFQNNLCTYFLLLENKILHISELLESPFLVVSCDFTHANLDLANFSLSKTRLKDYLLQRLCQSNCIV